MRRLLAIVPVLVLAACAGGHATLTPKTRLSVQVNGGHGVTRYSLTCRPAGGSAPEPTRACRALEDFVPPREASHAGCFCALYVKRIVSAACWTAAGSGGRSRSAGAPRAASAPGRRPM